MAGFGFEEMQGIQRELHEKYKHKWSSLIPEQARDQLLWMMIEAGEMADIIKKDGDEAVMRDPDARRHFIEETCDVLMYLNDVMLCYGITPEEIETVYREKHRRNMQRW